MDIPWILQPFALLQLDVKIPSGGNGLHKSVLVTMSKVIYKQNNPWIIYYGLVSTWHFIYIVESTFKCQISCSCALFNSIVRNIMPSSLFLIMASTLDCAMFCFMWIGPITEISLIRSFVFWHLKCKFYHIFYSVT